MQRVGWVTASKVFLLDQYSQSSSVPTGCSTCSFLTFGRLNDSNSSVNTLKKCIHSKLYLVLRLICLLFFLKNIKFSVTKVMYSIVINQLYTFPPQIVGYILWVITFNQFLIKKKNNLEKNVF